MSVVFKYKDFIGSIEVSTEDKCLYGSILYINDLITYEAKTVDVLEKEFKKAVEDYLKTCKKLGRKPSRSFKGTLNIRIGSYLHKKAAEYATLRDISINEYIKSAVQNQVVTDNGKEAGENRHKGNYSKTKPKMTLHEARRAIEELLDLKHYT